MGNILTSHSKTKHFCVSFLSMQFVDNFADFTASQERLARKVLLHGYTNGKAALSSSKGLVEWLHLQPCLASS